MKKLLLFLLVAVGLIAIPAAEGRIAIYEGVANTTTIGAGVQVSPKATSTLVVDLETLKATSISCVSVKVGGKTTTSFGIVPLDNYIFTTVQGPKGVIYSVFAKGESPSTQFKNFLFEGNLVVGANSWQKVSYSFGTESLPAKLTSISANIISQNGYDFLTQGSATYYLNNKSSLWFNIYSYTVDEIIDALRTQYLSRGYNETIIEPVTTPTPTPTIP